MPTNHKQEDVARMERYRRNGQVVVEGDRRNGQVVVVKPEGIRPLGSRWCKRIDNTKIQRNELVWKTMNWIYLA
jgi:hypothetical protein